MVNRRKHQESKVNHLTFAFRRGPQPTLFQIGVEDVCDAYIMLNGCVNWLMTQAQVERVEVFQAQLHVKVV